MRLSGSAFTNFPEATGWAAGLLTFSATAALASNKDMQITDESQCKGVLLKRTYILLKYRNNPKFKRALDDLHKESGARFLFDFPQLAGAYVVDKSARCDLFRKPRMSVQFF